MDGKKLVDLALELGFADAAIIDTDKLVFVPAFRTLCEENQCGKIRRQLCLSARLRNRGRDEGKSALLETGTGHADHVGHRGSAGQRPDQTGKERA